MWVPTWVLVVVALLFAGPILSAASGALSVVWHLFLMAGALLGWLGVLWGLFVAIDAPAIGLAMAGAFAVWSWASIRRLDALDR